MRIPLIHTYSIVAHDPAEQAWGVAVASKFLAAAAVVSWAQTGAGAIATQAFARVSFGPDGLKMLRTGKSAQETLAALLANDPHREDRQVGIVDAQGGVAAHTGKDCFAWAGHLLGEGFTCQGNILTGPETLDAMAEAYRSTSGELADKLVAALLAGDTVGGDRRGKQSAGVMVMKPGGGYGGDNDFYLDLRVDDDSEPVKKLAELVQMHHLFFGASRPEDLLPIGTELARELQTLLQRLGFYNGPIDGVWGEQSIEAFWNFCGQENLEERWSPDNQPDHLDKVVLEFIRSRFG